MLNFYLSYLIKFLNHPQPPTPIQVDNTTAVSFVNKELKQKCSKAIDMRFYWLQDRTEQGQFHLYWSPGGNNRGDYFTKKFSPADHVRKRPLYLFEPAKMMNNIILPSLKFRV